MAKRRATQHDSDADSDTGSPPRRRRLNNHESVSSSDSGTPPPQSSTGSALQTMIAKLVRLALSAEYARIPIRRTDIGTKVLGENGGRQFKEVFEGAQGELVAKFGMQMVELPAREREKLGMTQRRAAQASQKGQSSSSKSWTLISILPSSYKTTAPIVQPTRAPSLHVESTYTALYTFIVTLILLAPSESLPEAKLERYLKRANADSWTPIGQTDKVLQRMIKDGYLVKARDTSSGEEVIEYSVGPRGKVEVGKDGAEGLIRSMYLGSDMDDEDLDRRLQRSLGTLKRTNGDGAVAAEVGGEQDRTQTQTNGARRRGRHRRNGSDGDDD